MGIDLIVTSKAMFNEKKGVSLIYTIDQKGKSELFLTKKSFKDRNIIVEWKSAETEPFITELFKKNPPPLKIGNKGILVDVGCKTYKLKSDSLIIWNGSIKVAEVTAPAYIPL